MGDKSTIQHFEHLPCECSQCAPFTAELVSVEPHEFHLYDFQTAYCICSWVSAIPEGWESVSIVDLQKQYNDHLSEMSADE